MRRRDAFFICFGAFLVQVGVFGVHNNFGSIFHSLREEFNSDVTQLAWIGSFGMGTTFLVSPIAHVIHNRFGFHRLIGLSILLCTTSWLTSSFVMKVELLSLTYSILWGTGSGFAFYAATVLIQVSFTKNLSFANGIATSGSGFGALILGQLMTQLLNKFGYRWTFRACALIPLTFLLLIYSYHCSTKSGNKHLIDDSESGSVDEQLATDKKLLQNTELENTNTTEPKMKKSFNLNDLIDKELWHNRKYIVFVIGISVFLIGSHVPFVFLISHAVNAQITPTSAQFLIAILSIVSTLSKLFSGIFLVCQTFTSRTSLFFFSMFCLALSHLIVAKATNYWEFCAYAVAYGMSEGCFVSQLAAVVVDLLPSKEKVGVAIGNLFALMSIPMMLGPVFAGALVKNDSFTIPFYAATCVSLVGALLASVSKFVGNNNTASSNVIEENNNCDEDLAKEKIEHGDDESGSSIIFVSSV